MPITVCCPECGLDLSFEPSQGGKTATCSRCRAVLRVPGGPPPIPPAKARRKSGRGGLVLGAVAIIALAGVPVAFLVGRSHKPEPPPVFLPAPGVEVVRQPDAHAEPKLDPPKTEEAKPDPVALLQVLLAEVKKNGTRERVTDFSQAGAWQRRQYMAVDMRYDVQRTNSLVSPYVAIVTWTQSTRLSGRFPTRQQAEHAELNVPSEPSPARWKATLAFQKGQWVLKEVGWRSATLRIDKSYSTRNSDDDPVVDWWVAFGGEPPAGY